MNSTETETVAAFVARKGLSVEIVRDRGAQIEDGWEHHAYILALKLDGRTMETPWKQGLGIEDSAEDRPAEILDCLLSDARGLYIFPDETEEDGFERWAGEYGYDTDSRSAWKTYRAVVEQTSALQAFLGDDYSAALDLEAL